MGLFSGVPMDGLMRHFDGHLRDIIGLELDIIGLRWRCRIIR